MTIAGAVFAYNRVSFFKMCPICAGVAGTWLWMLAAKFLGYGVDTVILAMLMGGSVVGIAYQVEKHFPETTSGDKRFLWKLLFIPSGFVCVYSLLAEWWSVFLAVLIFLAATSFSLLWGKTSNKPTNQAVEELEKKMKHCC